MRDVTKENYFRYTYTLILNEKSSFFYGENKFFLRPIKRFERKQVYFLVKRREISKFQFKSIYIGKLSKKIQNTSFMVN